MEQERRTMETPAHALPGGMMLLVNFAVMAGGVTLFVMSIKDHGNQPDLTMLFSGLGTFMVGFFSMIGLFTLEPNEARVMVLFGSYKGTMKRTGFFWANPFYKKMKSKISLRSRNLEGQKLKVNDKRGNPIEIGAVIVWRVENTAQAVFDVENYESYVQVQSETAVRHLANSYPYDHGEEGETTLRSGLDEVSVTLKAELQERIARAGVVIEEARITHLAYAPEIASAMLRRQQAEAVIAARTKIVQGAVSMVEMALDGLDKKKIVKLDDERKAAMVSNLLVVLCGESEVHPVVNTGTLYS